MPQVQYDLVAETGIDIALNAGYMLAKGEISVSDSRELVSFIKTIARVFEQSGYDPNDYIGQVDSFAKNRLTEKYGDSPDKQADQHIRPKEEIYILYACDAWAGRDSMRMVGATTDRDMLHAMIAHELYESRMDFGGETGTAGVKLFREAYRKGYIPPGALQYGHVSESYNLDCHTSGMNPQYRRFHELLNMDDEEFGRNFPVLSDTSENEIYTGEIRFNGSLYRGKDGIDTLVEPWFDPTDKLPFPIPQDPDTSDVFFYALYRPDSDTMKYICMVEDSEGERSHEFELTEQEIALLKNGMESLCQREYKCDLNTLWDIEPDNEQDFEAEMEP